MQSTAVAHRHGFTCARPPPLTAPLALPFAGGGERARERGAARGGFSRSLPLFLRRRKESVNRARVGNEDADNRIGRGSRRSDQEGADQSMASRMVALALAASSVQAVSLPRGPSSVEEAITGEATSEGQHRRAHAVRVVPARAGSWQRGRGGSYAPGARTLPDRGIKVQGLGGKLLRARAVRGVLAVLHLYL